MNTMKKYFTESVTFPRYGWHCWWTLAYLTGFVAGFGWAR